MYYVTFTDNKNGRIIGKYDAHARRVALFDKIVEMQPDNEHYMPNLAMLKQTKGVDTFMQIFTDSVLSIVNQYNNSALDTAAYYKEMHRRGVAIRDYIFNHADNDSVLVSLVNVMTNPQDADAVSVAFTEE